MTGTKKPPGLQRLFCHENDPILVRREDGQLLLAWRGGLGPYLLQQSPDLGAGSWSYPGLLLNVTSTAVPIEHARMFFRVAQPPP